QAVVVFHVFNAHGKSFSFSLQGFPIRPELVEIAAGLEVVADRLKRRLGPFSVLFGPQRFGSLVHDKRPFLVAIVLALHAERQACGKRLMIFFCQPREKRRHEYSDAHFWNLWVMIIPLERMVSLLDTLLNPKCHIYDLFLKGSHVHLKGVPFPVECRPMLLAALPQGAARVEIPVRITKQSGDLGAKGEVLLIGGIDPPAKPAVELPS